MNLWRQLPVRDLEAAATIREVNALGAFLLADREGLWIHRGGRVPEELKMRVCAQSAEITALLLAAHR